MSQTNRDAANVLGRVEVVDGELILSWADGSAAVLSPRSNDAEEPAAASFDTFLLWADNKVIAHYEILWADEYSLRAHLEERMFLVGATHITHVSKDAAPDTDRFGRQRFIRTQGGMAPVVAPAA